MKTLKVKQNRLHAGVTLERHIKGISGLSWEPGDKLFKNRSFEIGLNEENEGELF